MPQVKRPSGSTESTPQLGRHCLEVNDDAQVEMAMRTTPGKRSAKPTKDHSRPLLLFTWVLVEETNL